MTCPKCQSAMKTVDKDGVHIDQCEGCKGIFLDRGELEQIAGAETAYYTEQQPPPYVPDAPPPPAQSRWGGGYYKDSPRPFGGGYPDSPRPYGHGRKRKRSFLEELFD